ncbi:aldo/keto reductase [Halalkalibacter alkaliphilus]|uniref:Aldo/keto reductase n=1 Tax=Halalkalibacter alkaliphilus TaxID=2917993 RepID=A0A9X2CX75_9BACI|nr:aldo/keto reductase [Halalkalibacter alkaliphilus]MCL7749944.1 aldo/keto reductase [Halalkalibacter alkaliphilus]
MTEMALEKRNISNSRLVLGCMSLGGGWNRNRITKEDMIKAERAIDAALSIEINMFDHADIYKLGKAEEVFGQTLKGRQHLREQIVIQTKCGLRIGEGGLKYYDFSKEHILNAVDGSLKRLGTDYIDILLLHRPDPLMEVEEVAAAFEYLNRTGKVKHFGVSNMNKAQIELLKQAVSLPFVANQIELSLSHVHWVEEGIYVNQAYGAQVNFPEELLAYCRKEQIQIQAWSPLAKGLFSGNLKGKEPQQVLHTAELVQRMAQEKGTTCEAIVLAWLMRHPANIQPIIGTINPERIRACKDAGEQARSLTRQEWYALFKSARGREMP